MKTYKDLNWSQLDLIGYRQAASLYEFSNYDREKILTYIKNSFSVIENTVSVIIFKETDSSVIRFLSKY